MPEKENGSWITQVLSWAKGQEFNNLMLLGILSAVGYGSHYAITIAIPAHLNQIQSGYRELTTEIQERHQAERTEAIRTYDRWIEWIREDNAARKGRPAGDASPSMLATPDSR